VGLEGLFVVLLWLVASIWFALSDGLHSIRRHSFERRWVDKLISLNLIEDIHEFRQLTFYLECYRVSRGEAERSIVDFVSNNKPYKEFKLEKGFAISPVTFSYLAEDTTEKKIVSSSDEFSDLEPIQEFNSDELLVEPNQNIYEIKVGDSVFDKRFGDGQVVSITGEGYDAIASVDFPSSRTIDILLRFKTLEKRMVKDQ
jgi:hypothetical protein